jgi:hypothetical protein
VARFGSDLGVEVWNDVQSETNDRFVAVEARDSLLPGSFAQFQGLTLPREGENGFSPPSESRVSLGFAGFDTQPVATTEFTALAYSGRGRSLVDRLLELEACALGSYKE